MIIAIDFDGTLAEYTEWKGIAHIGAPIKGAIEAVKELHEQGHELIIFTTRVSPEYIKIAEKRLEQSALHEFK